MEEYPGVIWGGSFDEDLHQLITVFASADLPNEAGLVSLHELPFDWLKIEASRHQPGPYARSLFFDEHTVENLCNAVSKAEDAVICVDAAGQKSFRPASILTGAEREQIFSTVKLFHTCVIVGFDNHYIYRSTHPIMARWWGWQILRGTVHRVGRVLIWMPT